MAENKKIEALVVNNAQDVRNELARWADKAHILTPFKKTDFDENVPGFRPVMRVTFIEAEKEKQEVYPCFDCPGNVSLAKNGLGKLSDLAGIKWQTTPLKSNHPLIATCKAKGRIRDLDGTYRERELSKTVDLRDGSPEAEFIRTKQSQKALDRARTHIAALAETKAMNRVIRALLGIKSSYHPNELNKPFLVLKLALNAEDPDVKRTLIEEEIGLRNSLFPGTTAEETIEGENEKNAATGEKPPIDLPKDHVRDITDDASQAQSKSNDQNPDKGNVSREDLIKEIERLYSIKTHEGKRSSARVPLEECDTPMLLKIKESLIQMETVKEPAPTNDDII